MTYKIIEHGLVEKLRQVQDIFELLEADSALIDQIRRGMDRLSSKQYTIAVVGQFKRGKSSLINTLLGRRLLPADVLPATASVNRVTFGGTGTQPRAVARLKDGTAKPLTLDEILAFGTKLTPEFESQAAQVEEITVYVPARICENHVDILDTPGLNDEANMTAITYGMLERADAVIFVVSALYPIEETELQHLRNIILSRNIRHVIFAVTFIDLLEDEDEPEAFQPAVDRVLAFTRQRILDQIYDALRDKTEGWALEKAHAMLDAMHIFGVSSKNALDAFSTNDAALRRKSGFDRFHDSLLNIITAKQVDHATSVVADDIHVLLSTQLSRQYAERTAAYEAMLAQARGETETVRARCGQWGRHMSLALTRVDGEIEARLARLHQAKNTLASAFIKALSGIRENDHGVIEQAIVRTTADEARRVDSEALAQVKASLRDCLEAALEDFAAQTMSDQPQNAAEADVRDVCLQLVAEARDMIRDAFEDVVFAWDPSPLPSAPDLSQCDVIQPIFAAVDGSLAETHRSLSACLPDLRRRLFQKINERADSLIAQYQASEEEAERVSDMRLKSLQSNYEKFTRDAETILRDTDEMMRKLRGLGGARESALS